MGRAQPVELTSMNFATKGKACDFFQAMLNRYSDGERINDEDSKLLFELIQRHPDDKIGVGISYFYRNRNPEQPTSCFHIMRTNGELTDFSYLRCIRRTKPTPQEYYYRACRFSVSPYLTQKKNELFDQGPVYCSATGEEVTKETSEYRHTEPAFKTLIANFAEEKGITVSRDLFVEDQDMQYNVRFIDARISQNFIKYHKEHANLSIFGGKKG